MRSEFTCCSSNLARARVIGPILISSLDLSLAPTTGSSIVGGDACVVGMSSSSTPPLHVVVLRKFRIWSRSIYFHNLGWIGETGRSHRSSYVYKTSKVLHLWHRVVAPVLSHWCRNIKFFMTLWSASSASSSTPVRGRNPRVWSTRVRPRSPANHYNITNR
jgi:hypothetical protein